MAELKKIKMDDIEGMIRLADDVLNQMERNANVYDDDGIPDKIAPFRERILGIFRNGAEQNSVTNETEFCADESVPDEYLLKLFAMRIRDRRITGVTLSRDVLCISQDESIVSSV